MVESKQSLKREIERMQKQLETLTAKLDSISETEEVGRIRTYIRGFDERIGGGIPRSHVVLLAGPAGTMKSSLALSILLKNIQEGTDGSYLTFEEGKDSLLRTASELSLEVEGDAIVDVGEMRRVEQIAKDAGNWFDIVIKFLRKSKNKKRTSLVVIDSLNALLSFDSSSSRNAVSSFFHSLRDLQMTALVIDEAEGPMKFTHHQDRLADGVILMGCEINRKSEMRHTIHCGKMRHTKHSMDYYHLDFKNGEFLISEMSS